MLPKGVTRETGAGAAVARAWALVLDFGFHITRCVTLGKSQHLSEPQPPQLWCKAEVRPQK